MILPPINFKDWINNNLTLNFYILKTADVDPAIIEIIANNPKLKTIAEKKSMIPVTHDNHENHVKYLLTNQEQWQ